MSDLTQKTKIVIGAALVAVFLLGVMFGQTAGSGRASFVCPLVPSVYQQAAVRKASARVQQSGKGHASRRSGRRDRLRMA